MNRSEIFIDAGYLLAEGAKRYVTSAVKRGDVTWSVLVGGRISREQLIAKIGQAALATTSPPTSPASAMARFFEVWNWP